MSDSSISNDESDTSSSSHHDSESSGVDESEFESEHSPVAVAEAETSEKKRYHDESGYFSRQKLNSADSDAVGSESELDESVQSQEQVEMGLKLKEQIPEILKAVKPMHEMDINAAWRANLNKMAEEEEEIDQSSIVSQPKMQAIWEAKSFEDGSSGAIDQNFTKTFVSLSGSEVLKIAHTRKHIIKQASAIPQGSYWVKTDQNLRVRNVASGREGQLCEDLRDLASEDIRKLAPKALVCTASEAEKKTELDALLKQLESPDVFVFMVNQLLKVETPELEGKPTYEIVRKSEVFKAISNFYGGGQAVFPYVLEQKYLRLEKIVPQERPLPSVPNARDRGAVLKRLESKFCRRCFTYGCLIHATDMDNLKIRESIMQEPVSADRIATRLPCSVACYKLRKLDKAKVSGETRGELDDWSQDEKALFLSAGRIWQNDPCRLAEVIITKNCSEVADRLKWMTEEGQGFPSTGTPSFVPGKVRVTTTMSSFSSYCKTHQLLLGVDQEDRPAVPPCYYPCDHDGPCQANSAKCQCYSNNIPCEKYCRCYFGKGTCRNMFPGCKCVGSCGPKCDCVLALRECDIDICGCKEMTKLRKEQVQKGTDSNISGIKSSSEKLQGCKNAAIQFKRSSKTIRMLSAVAGWGLFALSDIPAHQLVGEYCGELVSVAESERRGQGYDSQGTTYLFNRDTDTTIDGMHFANVTRYINSAPEDEANCYPLCKNVAGTLRIGLYAKRDIKSKEELFFDYQQALKKEQEQEVQTVSSKCQANPSKLPTSKKRKAQIQTKKSMEAVTHGKKRVPSARKQTTTFPVNPLRAMINAYDYDKRNSDESSCSLSD